MRHLAQIIAINLARLIFVSALFGVLFVGLNWALQPEERPDAEAIAQQQADEAAALASEPPGASPAPTAAATGEAPPAATPSPTEQDAQVLIALAEPPSETVVQVLEAGGGAAAVDRVVTALEQLGYDVINVTRSSREVAVTTVWWTAEAEAEARALRARDPRFQDVGPNQGLSEGVDLHVLVGPGF